MKCYKKISDLLGSPPSNPTYVEENSTLYVPDSSGNVRQLKIDGDKLRNHHVSSLMVEDMKMGDVRIFEFGHVDFQDDPEYDTISGHNIFIIKKKRPLGKEIKEAPLFSMKDYQEKIARTAQYGDAPDSVAYTILGLTGEAGEVADKYKKVLRDKGAKIDEDTRQEMLKECGDVLWYLTRTAHELGSSLEEVAQMNIDKLYSRLKRNQIGGSGDNR